LNALSVPLLEELTAGLLDSLGVQDRMAAALQFFVPAYAEGASIRIDDGRAQNYVLSTGTACGVPLTLPLQDAGKSIGILQLHIGAAQKMLPQTLAGMLADRLARTLAHALAYERERRTALAFQYAAVTTELPHVPGHRLDAIYEAGRAEALIGGDWYDAFVLEDGRLILSIGDVMGSGLPAAVAMVNIRQSLRTMALLHPDPVLMLEAANRTILAEFPDRFATTFIALIDPVTHTCTYANAGHPPPLLRLPDGAAVHLRTRGVPLGVPGFSEQLRADHVVLPAAGLLLLYTDGLTEANRRPIEGEALLHETLAKIDPTQEAPAATIYKRLLAHGSRDDVAIVTMYVDARPEIPRWRFNPEWSDAAHRVRREIGDILLREGLEPPRLCAFETIFAEIIANVIRHAGGTAEVVLQRQHDRFVLHVLDKGPGFHVVPRLPNDLFSENGRGLYLISRLADHFSVERRPGGGSHARITLLDTKGAHR
jgi:serine phosphatase RsbU (regulator of sigma subunit)/anti-sigma regulatory factor (Ser/Thr protein kinase)